MEYPESNIDFSNPEQATAFLEEASRSGTFGETLTTLSLEDLYFLQDSLGSILGLHPDWVLLVPELLQAIETKSKQ